MTTLAHDFNSSFARIGFTFQEMADALYALGHFMRGPVRLPVYRYRGPDEHPCQISPAGEPYNLKSGPGEQLTPEQRVRSPPAAARTRNWPGAVNRTDC